MGSDMPGIQAKTHLTNTQSRKYLTMMEWGEVRLSIIKQLKLHCLLSSGHIYIEGTHASVNITPNLHFVFCL